MNLATQLLPLVAEASLRASVIVALVLLLRPGVRKFFGSGLVSLLWTVVLLRLVILWQVESHWSFLNIWPRTRENIETVSVTGGVWKTNVTVSETIANPPALPEAASPAWIDPSNVLAAVWVLGALGMLIHLGTRLWRTAALSRRTRPVTDVRILELYEAIPGALRQGVRLRESADLPVAGLIGVWRPQICMPCHWLSNLTDQQLRHVFLHELGHARRGDLAMQFLFALVRCVHWFNPLVWLAARCFRNDAELACDAWVLERETKTGRERYGDTLIEVAQRIRSTPVDLVAVGMAANRSVLFSRIRMAGEYVPLPPGRFWMGAFVGSLATVALVTDRVSAQAHPPITPSQTTTESIAPANPQAATPTVTPSDLQIEIESKFIELSEVEAAKLGFVRKSGSEAERLSEQPLQFHSILEDGAQKLLSELDKVKGVELLSAPRVTTNDGELVKVEITREFYYPTAYEPDKNVAGGFSPTTIEKTDIGKTLEVKPLLHPDGFIDLALKTTIVDFEGFIDYGKDNPMPVQKADGETAQTLFANVSTELKNGIFKQPIFSTQSVSTTVTVVGVGHTVVLKGSKVDIAGKNGTVTLILITPRMVSWLPPGLNKIPRKKAPVPKSDQPLAIVQEANKKGFVRSPFAPDKGWVDVTGFPPGTEVKCPYTENVFRVP